MIITREEEKAGVFICSVPKMRLKNGKGGFALKSERKTVVLGNTDFSDIIFRNVFYVDKTYFIRDWYNSADQATLITRPRR